MQCKHINFSHFQNLGKEIHLIWNSHPSLRTNTYVVSVIFGLHLHKNVIYEYIQAPGISTILRAHLDKLSIQAKVYWECSYGIERDWALAFPQDFNRNTSLAKMVIVNKHIGEGFAATERWRVSLSSPRHLDLMPGETSWGWGGRLRRGFLPSYQFHIFIIITIRTDLPSHAQKKYLH